MRDGTDVSLVSFGKMVGYCLQAAAVLEKEGISCEVVNLRSLKPIDRGTIAQSIKKTHRIITVEEGWPQSGIGAEIISIATEECFDELDAPPERVTGVDVPMPYSGVLESAALPSVDDIIDTARNLVK